MTSKSIKCVVCGDGGVGKTSMLISYSKNEFPRNYVPTIFETYTAKVNVSGDSINLQLWDTAGLNQYNFPPLT